MITLSQKTIESITPSITVERPSKALFSLPEKVLQFGTGVLLRGLPDYFIDKANKQGIFNGRIVVVKSTSRGDTDAFAKQDSLYTHCVRGIADGKNIEQVIINSSISRVINAGEQWDEVLACAANPGLQVIISNTTEVGISLHPNEDVYAKPPVSFPGKLLAFLYRRYQLLGGGTETGMVIIPTELLPGNGSKLKDIVGALAVENKLEPEFRHWLNNCNDFCNSLVDRIVPGALAGNEKLRTEKELGYTDDLMIMSEVYRLWAIETKSERTIQRLSFAAADKGVVIAPDINLFRELKLRLLNGSHTFTCALALLMGFSTVKEAMDDEDFAAFISSLVYEEIIPSVTTADLSKDMAAEFAAAVLDRYRNPFIEHQWLSIALQYTLKMKTRNISTLLAWYRKNKTIPSHMVLGFASYLLLLKPGQVPAKPINAESGDDKALVIQQLWLTPNTNNFVQQVLSDTNLWDTNLNALPGFAMALATAIDKILEHGIRQAIKMGQTI